MTQFAGMAGLKFHMKLLPALSLALIATGTQPIQATVTCWRIFDSKEVDEVLKERWTIDGPESDYEPSFQRVIEAKGDRYDPNYFLKRLKKRKAKGLSTHVLDLMGSGYFVRDAKVADSITGLRTGRLKLTKEEIRKYGTRPVVLGDVFEQSTWLKLRNAMKRRKIPAFDLIVIRPEGGWQSQYFRSSDEEAGFIVTILTNALSVISPNGEVFFKFNNTNIVGDAEQHPLIHGFVWAINHHTKYRVKLSSLQDVGKTQTLVTEGFIHPATGQR